MTGGLVVKALTSNEKLVTLTRVLDFLKDFVAML